MNVLPGAICMSQGALLTRKLSVELAGTGVGSAGVCPGLVETEWSCGFNIGNPRAMSAADTARGTWTAFGGAKSVYIQAIRDVDAFRCWRQAEDVVLAPGSVNQIFGESGSEVVGR
jgi:NAD(P)-dependent dehydrogenase (short-subunit alcohol dehydrogenase family)